MKEKGLINKLGLKQNSSNQNRKTQKIQRKMYTILKIGDSPNDFESRIYYAKILSNLESFHELII